MKYTTTHKQTERENVTERRWYSGKIHREWKIPLLPHTTRGDCQRPLCSDRGLGEEISTPLREHPRHSIGLREGQCQHEQHRERRPRERGSSGAPHTGNARRPHTIPREMRPRASHSTAPLRHTGSQHALHAFRSTVQTSSRLRFRLSRQSVRANGVNAQQRRSAQQQE